MRDSFSYVRVRCTSIDEHVVAKHQTSTTTIVQQKHRNHSTAVQHGAVDPHNKHQIKYAPISARQRRQADGVGSPQHVVEHVYSWICSQYQLINRNLLGLHNNIAGVMRGQAKGLSVPCSFSQSSLFRPYMRRPVLFWGTMQLLAFASR